MKQDIHPNYHEVTVTCSCVKGDTIKVDICNKCHPFFSGKQKIVDVGGRVEKFKKTHNI